MNHEITINNAQLITTGNITDVLCMESGGFDYWCEICFDENTYEAARKRLLEKAGEDNSLCYEDVLAEILEGGGSIKVWDREEDEDHDINLDALLNGFRLYVENNSSEDLEDIDGCIADEIMQYACFGEVIYS